MIRATARLPRRLTGAAALALLGGCAGDGAPASSASRVFVADERGGTISVIDAEARRVIARVDLAEARQGGAVRYLPHNVQVSPDGRTVWATAASQAFYTSGFAGADDEQLVVLDAARLVVTARIPLRGLLSHVVFDPAGRFAYVTAANADQVIELDVATLRETRRFRVGLRRAPHGARLCAGRLFVANALGRSVSRVDLATGAVDEVRVGGSPVQVACSPDGSTAFTALQDARAVERVDMATRVVTRLDLPDTARGPAQVYLAPGGARLWVADQGMLTSALRVGNRVYEVDVASWRVLGSTEVGLGAHGVVVSRDGTRVYVSSTLENSVAIIDAATRRHLAAVPVGTGPNGISLVDDRGAMP
jgi:YVTN family beta-propeller protein